MKIIFKRTFTLTCYEVLLTLRYEEEREDVQRFLQKFKDGDLPNDRIAPKIAKYLEQLGLLHKNQKDLTAEGEKTLKDALFQAYEQGVYWAWITKRDKLLGTRILALNRVSIDKSDRRDRDKSDRKKSSHALEVLPSLDQTEQTLLLAEENPKTPQSYQVRSTQARLLQDDFSEDYRTTAFLDKYKGFYIKEKEKDDSIILLEAAKGDEKTSIRIKGNLSLKIRDKDTGCEANLSKLSIPLLDKSFSVFITDAFDNNIKSKSSDFQRWDSDKLSLRVKFDDLRGEEKKRGIRDEEFEVTDNFFGGAGEIRGYDLQLLADDELEAKKWRNGNFAAFLVEDYKLPAIWEKYLEELQKEFFPIAFHLKESPLPDEMELKEVVSMDNNAYWHYFAPIDLKP